jgi:hypothetical protein
MRSVAATVVVAALIATPTASAKILTKVVGIGAGGASVELTGLDWGALRMGNLDAPPSGRFVLVYPLMERGVPAQPGRFYPETGAACFSWNRAAVGECWRVSAELATRLSVLPAIVGEPTILSTLRFSGRPGLLTSNGAVAIELAFGRSGIARPLRKRPLGCWPARASWTGPDAPLRPDRFWACRSGIWTAGKLYPVGGVLSAV